MRSGSPNTLMPKRYKYAVYGSSHPAYGCDLIGRYRWKWFARLRAWWWERTDGSLQWPYAYVREENVTVFVKDGKAV